MEPTDDRLVALSRGGDSAAFEALVRRHFRKAFAVALHELGNRQDAEDACQDAFLAALTRIEDCRDTSRFVNWLLRIVRNHARSLRRRNVVRAAEPLDAPEPARASDGRARPDRDAERAQLRDRLAAALGRLSGTDRQIVLLHDLEGWRHREIAAELGLTEGTVRVYLTRARKALRAHLASVVST